MAYTWLQAAEILGFHLHVSAPAGYQLDPQRVGQPADGVLQEFADPIEACRNAHLVTTDVWTSMGFEAENEERRKALSDWCVDADIMAVVDIKALFMHCLIAHAAAKIHGHVIQARKHRT